MLASIDFAECVLTEVLTELMNGLPSSSRLADPLVQEYYMTPFSTIHSCTDFYVIKIHYTIELVDQLTC